MKSVDAKMDADAVPLLIRRVEAIPVSVSLTAPVVMGGGQRFDRSESLIVRIEASNGMTGWGEASAAPTMTGETLASMVHAVEHYLAPRLVGRNALNRGMLSRSLSAAMAENSGAKAACDIAIHDLAGRHLNIPLVELLGGRYSSRCAHLRNSATQQSTTTSRKRWPGSVRGTASSS